MLLRVRGMAAAATVAAMSIGLAADAGASTPIGAADKKAIEQTLAKVFATLPRPAKGYRLDRANGSREIAPATSARVLANVAPAEAAETRVYEKAGTGDSSEESVVLEVRVYINQERSLPDPLGSEGGTPQTFTQDGMPCLRVSLAGVDVDAGRVALPLTGEDEGNALTVLRAYVGAPAIEPYLVDLARGRTPATTPWDARKARRPSEVRTIVVEYYGPRAEVERLLKATRSGPLRALLTP